MARPRIRPSARKIPISISVSPALADKIDEYSHQIRFSRSKFLAQAVTEAINKIELRHDLEDYDFRNLSDDRMAYLAKLRFDGADEINPTIVQQLKDSIEEYENRQESPTNAPSEPSTPPSAPVALKFPRLDAGQYSVMDVVGKREVGHIFKDANLTERPWVFSNHLNGDRFSSRTLADAKDIAREELERV